jgi:DNA-binding CsgD family transcriptional regulator/tetratricopeptide (TPR) repeat protein
MLHGRTRERVRVEALLDAARGGRGGALVIRGEAGIGKTALLQDAATVEGFTILRTRGIETESEIGFSGLHDLLSPIIAGLSELPPRQAEAVSAALSIGPSPPTERLAISAGALCLLATASQARPIVAIVDDAHLLDRASADALSFVARRVGNDPVAMLFAIRQGEASTFSAEGIDEFTLESLDEASAIALLDQRSRPLASQAKARVLELAGGNPLALLELPEPADHDPAVPVASGAMSAGSLLARAFGGRIERLPQATRTALAVAAASDTEDLQPVLTACRHLGIASEAFEPAEAAGIIEVAGNSYHFRHPLVRAAAYAVAPPSVRREAHQALASALFDHRTEERWAWHRALAAVGPDRDAAAALETIAGRSINASSRTRAFERAARLSADEPSRTRRLLAAALAAEDAGNLGTAESLAGEARAGAIETSQLAEIDHLLGRIWLRQGESERAAERLTTGARLIASSDPDRAALMLADAVEATIHDLDRAEKIAAEAMQLFRAGSQAEQLVQLRLGDVYGWRGQTEQASACWRRAADLADVGDPGSMRLAAEALFSAGLDDEAVAVARSAVELARARSAHNALTQSLEFLAQAEGRRGRLLDALAAVAEEIDLVIALGQTREERYASVAAAWIEAALGRDPDGRRLASRATELEARMGWATTRSEPLGVLELAMGRPEVAVRVFERVPVETARLGADAIAPRSFVPAYVEALVRVGRSDDARAIATAYAEVAERSGRPLAVALARRCQGLAGASVGTLESAVELFEAIGNPYEGARTRLSLGQLLGRLGRRPEARAMLIPALDAFTVLGADGWAERARSELAAVGTAVRRPATPRHSELTPQERTVAQLVATGLTNREIAERLFVTTNTVETHLRHIFQKLDVRSRTQLAISFSGLSVAAAPGAPPPRNFTDSRDVSRDPPH